MDVPIKYNILLYDERFREYWGWEALKESFFDLRSIE